MGRSSYDALATSRYDKIHGGARVIVLVKREAEAVPYVPPVNSIGNPVFIAAIKALGFASYNDYLASDHWRGFRRMVLAREKRCAVCKQRATVVHHKTYERIGHELYTDVEAMCSNCHDLLHGIHRKRGISLASFGKARSALLKKLAVPMKKKKKRKKR